jgi:hypothetical protein
LRCRPSAPGRSRRRHPFEECETMLDLMLFAIAAGFFALSIGYGYFCERL